MDMKTIHSQCEKELSENAPPSDASGMPYRYLTTVQAADYLRKSVSWLLRQGDIPYLPGRPNVYVIDDLEAWVDRHKHRPLN
jgi:hypothetical protein